MSPARNARPRHLESVGQEDDRCLQPFGAVHGHDPHFVAGMTFEVALHLLAPGLDPVQERLERRWMAALEGQRRGQELVERIVRLGTEPRQDAPAALARPKHLGEQLMRPHEVDAGQKLRELARRIREVVVLPRAGAQHVPQALLVPVPGEREQPLLGKTEQRPFEHRRQGQVVLGQQQEAAERDQVHDRELIRQHHAVDAGDVDAGLLHLAHQEIDQGGAPPHQDHYVVGADRPAA